MTPANKHTQPRELIQATNHSLTHAHRSDPHTQKEHARIEAEIESQVKAWRDTQPELPGLPPLSTAHGPEGNGSAATAQ